MMRTGRCGQSAAAAERTERETKGTNASDAISRLRFSIGMLLVELVWVGPFQADAPA
jgi:hypothetical protein